MWPQEGTGISVRDSVSEIAGTVARLCVGATRNLPEDVVASLNEAAEAVEDVAGLVKA